MPYKGKEARRGWGRQQSGLAALTQGPVRAPSPACLQWGWKPNEKLEAQEGVRLIGTTGPRFQDKWEVQKPNCAPLSRNRLDILIHPKASLSLAVNERASFLCRGET